MQYISNDSTDIDECIAMTLRALSAASEMNIALNYPSFEAETFGYDKGKKYSRVWRDNGTQRFVCFFVQRDTGDVWKGSWKAPVLNFTRGNIMTTEGRKAITLDKVSDSGYFYPAF